MNSERTRGFGFVMLMVFAGLASGVLTAALSDGHLGLDLGISFGVIMAFCLAITGLTRSAWRLVCLVLLTACAFYISVFFATFLEMGAASQWTGTDKTLHLIALFAGGMAGGFIVLSGALILAKSKMSLGVIALKALLWSVFGGALAPIAWPLGPSLGMWVWSGLHAVGLTTPTNTFQNAMYGGTASDGAPNQLYALFVMWQTGMGFALGIALRSSRAVSPSEDEQGSPETPGGEPPAKE
jgi:hypothetical protein